MPHKPAISTGTRQFEFLTKIRMRNRAGDIRNALRNAGFTVHFKESDKQQNMRIYNVKEENGSTVLEFVTLDLEGKHWLFAERRSDNQAAYGAMDIVCSQCIGHEVEAHSYYKPR